MQNETSYLNLLSKILAEGLLRTDRTGTGCYSVFGVQLTYDISKSFPLLTTKKVNFKAILVELLWFLSGSSNISFLHEHNVHIWDQWADEHGNLGPIYGHMWRKWPSKRSGGVIDQITQLEHQLKTNPFSRRHILSAWNVDEIPYMALPPCHMLCQFYVSTDYELSCMLYQRSGDCFLGVPFNIACYSLLTMMLASILGYKASRFIHTIGDAHIYTNHIEQVKKQLGRDPINNDCFVRIDNKDKKSILEFEFSDFELINYVSADFIKAPISV